ncbi:hypothetical protein SO3561_10351 [Streptomyces olivochromogenes]|uniref:Uncharacterized protein n=1 Tax=Streptomyces olivochromogenes TaxID=1963 RepID=A0A286PGU7_STROL|nr:hypothetical protein SO3561_10351 [Streptomyces olivochromogenes]
MGSHPRATRRPCPHARTAGRSPDQELRSICTFQDRLRYGFLPRSNRCAGRPAVSRSRYSCSNAYDLPIPHSPRRTKTRTARSSASNRPGAAPESTDARGQPYRSDSGGSPSGKTRLIHGRHGHSITRHSQRYDVEQHSAHTLRRTTDTHPETRSVAVQQTIVHWPTALPLRSQRVLSVITSPHQAATDSLWLRVSEVTSCGENLGSTTAAGERVGRTNRVTPDEAESP